ncbi:DUF4396 domain-containing protein [Roseibium sp.]|uniref:DUF4396 domain-containing protein n=1 Tax=Roseibium sp. TaxID=1936156 RepID=UPI003BB037C7
MLQGAMIVWFSLTAASLAFVIWDSLFNGVTSWVQRLAWILVVAYTGPVGCFLYLMTCRRPFPGGHDQFTNKPWKQAINSEMHCLAGDATGIVIAAAIVPMLGLTNGWDSTFEYAAGFLCGLFVFQALMMRAMFDGDYWKAVRKTFFAETVSMNCVMAGMLPTMILLSGLWPGSENPLSAEFWFRMNLASVVGLVTAYPVNYWLVTAHLKHGCMTMPGKDTPALGHRSPEMQMEAMGPHTHGTSHGAHRAMEMAKLSLPIQVLLIAASFALLLLAALVTDAFIPIRFGFAPAMG